MKRGYDMVKEDPGDASIVLRLYLLWSGSVEEVMRGEGTNRAHVRRRSDGLWELAFAVQRGPLRRQRHFVGVDPDNARRDRWPFVKLAPGVWDVPTSIFVEGQLHAFVTIIGAPVPAPWERPAP
jgi:hypothetical protein